MTGSEKTWWMTSSIALGAISPQHTGSPRNNHFTPIVVHWHSVAHIDKYPPSSQLLFHAFLRHAHTIVLMLSQTCWINIILLGIINLFNKWSDNLGNERAHSVTKSDYVIYNYIYRVSLLTSFHSSFPWHFCTLM